MPLWLLTNLTCLGSFPSFVIFGVGLPVVVTVNEKGVPTVALAVTGLDIVRGITGGPVVIRPIEPKSVLLLP